MTVTTYKWSVEEYHLMIDSGLLAGKAVELLNGEIVEMSPEREEHTYTNDDVAELLRAELTGLAKIRESHRTLAKDLSEKSQTYARNGIPEYWIIDLVNKKLIVQTCPQGSNYQQLAEYTKGSVSPLAFPNLKITLDQLLLF